MGGRHSLRHGERSRSVREEPRTKPLDPCEHVDSLTLVGEVLKLVRCTRSLPASWTIAAPTLRLETRGRGRWGRPEQRKLRADATFRHVCPVTVRLPTRGPRVRDRAATESSAPRSLL